MEPISITALILSIGSILGYFIKKKLKKSSCTSESSNCTSSMQVDLKTETKNELHNDLRKVKHDIINEISPHILKLQTDLRKLKNNENIGEEDF